MSRTPKTEKPAHLEYTGQTEGAVPYAPNLAQAVTPGQVLAPNDAEHAAQLLATGHFVETTKRVTKLAADAEVADATETPEQPGNAAQEPE